MQKTNTTATMTATNMTGASDNLITAIDLGSSKTVVLVAEVTTGGLRYRGHGVAESRGSHKGVIVDLDRAAALETVHGFLDDVGVYYCGRYGNWDHAWTDEAFISGEQAARKVLGEG